MRVKSVDGVRVCLHGAIVGHGHMARFVGYTWKDGWVASDEVVELPSEQEYRRAVQEGALVAADEATARECGVLWVPAKQPKKASSEDL